MPPKAAKPVANAATNAMYYEEQRVSDAAVALALRLAALKKAYVDRMERTAALRQQHILLTRTLCEEEEKLQAKRDERMDVLTDYARQYRTDERDSIAELALLDTSVNRLQDEKAQLQRQIEETETFHDQQIKEMKAQHEELLQKVNEMEKQFTAMLEDIQQSIQAV